MNLRLWLISIWLLLCTPVVSADPDAIRAAILGEGTASGEMDLNQDGVVDVADLVMDVQGDIEITIDDRFAVMDSAAAQFDSFAALPLAEKNAAMVAWLLEQPLIKDAGIDNEVVWAYFIDGLPIMFSDNRRLPGDPLPESAASLVNPASSSSQRAPSVAATLSSSEGPQGVFHPEWQDAEQPGSTHVLFLNSFESGFYSTDITPHIQQRLQDVGYSLGSVSTDPNPTMADFKSQVQNLGLFYIAAHSGDGRFEEVIGSVRVVGKYFAIQSPIAATRESFQALLESDVVKKRLVPMYGSITNGENGKGYAYRWAFTNRFIEAYFSFAPNSLSYMDACNSNNADIRAALLSSGAAMLVDWDKSVWDDDAAKTANHFFRRLLGSEQVADWDSSPVRPFDIDSVWQEMGRHMLLKDKSGVNLKFVRTETSDFALFVPAIRSMQVYGADATLHLYGLFGANPGAGGKVFLGDVSMPIQSWDKWEIVIDLPPTASGEVHVSKDGISGNKVALSRYQGMGSAQFASVTSGIFASANFTLNFRGDFSPFRVKPDDEPVYWKSQDFVDYAQDPEFPKFVTRYVEFPLGLSHVAYLDGLSEISYSYGGNLDNISCEDPGSISGAGTLPVILTNPTYEPPGTLTGLLGLTELDAFMGFGVNIWVIGLDSLGSIGTYSNPGCDGHHNDMVNLIASGLKAVDILADAGVDGTVFGKAFQSEEISPYGYHFTTSLTIPTMVPQPAHDPSAYPD